MKTLRLSDEDYLALLQALTDAAEAHEYVRNERESLKARAHYQTFVDEAVRLHELLKPVEYADGEA